MNEEQCIVYYHNSATAKSSISMHIYTWLWDIYWSGDDKWLWRIDSNTANNICPEVKGCGHMSLAGSLLYVAHKLYIRGVHLNINLR